MPPIYDDYIDESGFGRVSALGSNDPTILEDVESYCDEHESGFGRVSTLFSDSTILGEVSIDYDDSMPPTYDDYIDESGFGRVSNLGSNDPTILEGVESYCDNYESGFGEVIEGVLD